MYLVFWRNAQLSQPHLTANARVLCVVIVETKIFESFVRTCSILVCSHPPWKPLPDFGALYRSILEIFFVSSGTCPQNGYFVSSVAEQVCKKHHWCNLITCIFSVCSLLSAITNCLSHSVTTHSSIAASLLRHAYTAALHCKVCCEFQRNSLFDGPLRLIAKITACIWLVDLLHSFIMAQTFRY